MSALLPPNRKLMSLAMRGADWKALKKSETVNKETKDRVFAYWHFEQELKEQYFGNNIHSYMYLFLKLN